jgi:SPX domain protein involved in polyphosphate accumulation
MEIVERYEYKFLVEESLIPCIRSFARSTSRLDPHARADGAYTIRSLYFDTAAFDLYAANQREQASRFKVRARMYPDVPSGPHFLEVKNRRIDVIVKTRAHVPCSAWQRAVECDPDVIGSLRERSRAAAAAFAAKVHGFHLRPVLLVEYEREAYVSELDSYARVTLDRRISVQSKTELDFDADPKRWRPIDHPFQTRTTEPITVLELKFERRPPAWMHAMVRKLELVRRSFSKYCYGLTNELGSPAGDRVPRLAASREGAHW